MIYKILYIKLKGLNIINPECLFFNFLKQDSKTNKITNVYTRK